MHLQKKKEKKKDVVIEVVTSVDIKRSIISQELKNKIYFQRFNFPILSLLRKSFIYCTSCSIHPGLVEPALPNEFADMRIHHGSFSWNFGFTNSHTLR